MRTDSCVANPLAPMTAPQPMLDTTEKSDGLYGLQHQVFHPLDARVAFQADADLAAFHAAIERATFHPAARG